MWLSPLLTHNPQVPTAWEKMLNDIFQNRKQVCLNELGCLFLDAAYSCDLIVFIMRKKREKTLKRIVG